MPSLFQVELTNYCNMACPICPHKVMTRPKRHMSFEVFKRVVDESKRLGWPIHWLHHFGEPLLHPRLERFLKYFKDNGLGDGGVSTNGLALNEDLSKVLIKNAKRVLIAIDTFNSKIYNLWRTGDYRVVFNNMLNFLMEAEGSGVKVEVQLMRTKFNVDEVINNGVPIFIKEVVKYPDAIDLSNRESLVPCNKCFNELCVLADGRVTVCCYDYDGVLSVGNVMDKPLDELWNGKEVNGDNELCRECIK